MTEIICIILMKREKNEIGLTFLHSRERWEGGLSTWKTHTQVRCFKLQVLNQQDTSQV